MELIRVFMGILLVICLLLNVNFKKIHDYLEEQRILNETIEASSPLGPVSYTHLHAAKVALGMGAIVTMLDVSPEKLSEAAKLFQGRVNTAMSNKYNVEKFTKTADLVIGAVLIVGTKAPHIITEDMVKNMRKGSVIIDVSIDQGGIVETIEEPTSFENPTFEKHGVIHCAIPNIPSCVARTATISFNNYVSVSYTHLKK